MSRILISPSRYVQGEGAINEIGVNAARLGTKALFTGGKRALAMAGAAVEASLSEKGIGFHREHFNGECSTNEINRLIDVAKKAGCDFVISAGGGKVIDTGKAVGFYMKIPVVVVPTIAATDAPCSALAVVYTDSGVFERYLVLPKNPDCVLVDTSVVAKAPVEFLVSEWEMPLPLSGKPILVSRAASPTCSPVVVLSCARLTRSRDCATRRCSNSACRRNSPFKGRW